MIKAEDVIQVKEWYKCEISKKKLKELMKRDDIHGIVYVGGWIMLLIFFGYFAGILFPSPWSIPVFLLYGIVVSSANARWHECSHGTPFKTNWMNEATFFIATAFELRDIVYTRWSHAMHHSYTIMNRVDQEILLTRPPKFIALVLNFFNLQMGLSELINTVMHAIGIPSQVARNCVPEQDFKRMYWWSRATLLPYVLAIIFAVVNSTWLPILLIVLPRFYGGFIQWSFILLQHGGLAEDVWDHRLSCRTMILNPVSGFLYMEMQYHVEHHMFPMVPFYNLKALHEEIKWDLPEPNKGVIDGFREMFPALIMQQKDPNYYIKKVISGGV